VKLTKKTGNPSKGQIKVSKNNWKAKAIDRRKENGRLRKRIKELSRSRDNWKRKYKGIKSGVASLSVKGDEKASRHQYNLWIIVLMIELYKYGGMSLRSCRHSLSCMLICMGLGAQLPSHTSIRNWLCKCGIHRVCQQGSSRGDYVIYLDESMSLGGQKILLVLGIARDRLRFDRSITHEDVEVLYIQANKEWKSKSIQEILRKIALRKNILYAVSDQGSNLTGAYKVLNYSHIQDCTHKLANYIKHLFSKDERLKSFRQLIGHLRQVWSSSRNKSQYMPPSMRTKLRFVNIFSSVNWANKMLDNWEDLATPIKDKLRFLKENQKFIQSLAEVELIFKTVCDVLKNKGFGLVQKQEILAIFEKLEVGAEGSLFMDKCRTYLERLTQQLESLGCQNLLCTSDIIESYFGKLKTKINANSRSGLTEFIFTAATFGASFSKQEVKQALESVLCKQLKSQMCNHKII